MPTLVTIPFSHFCEKARWALDHARVDYTEEGHVPGLHRRAVARACGRPGSVPVLVLDGDKVLEDSPLIVQWADQRATSDRKLLPSGGRERDEALELERHLDVDFAPHVRRLAYFHLLPNRKQTLELFAKATPRRENAIVRLAYPLLRGFMRKAMRIDAEGARRSRDRVYAFFDEMDARLSDGRPFLMGDRFGATDLAFAAFAAPLTHPAEHPVQRVPVEGLPAPYAEDARALCARPAGAFALRMYRENRRLG